MLKVLRSGLVWLPALLLALAAWFGVGLGIELLTQEHLEADARRRAELWARHVSAQVPELDAVFSGSLPTAQAQERLLAMHDMADLAQFKLLDNQGRLRLNSMSIGTTPQPEDANAHSSRWAMESARLQHMVLSLQRGDGDILPLSYAQVYVPLKLGARALGVAELTIDQTDLAATTAASMRRAGLMTSAAVTLTLLAVSVWVSRRLRRQRQVSERAHYLSAHDELTGALNRSQFAAALQRACKAQLSAGAVGKAAAAGTAGTTSTAGLAVLCVDLDRFTQINERYGHRAGDEILRRVAERLRSLLQGQDQLARLAGDRFVVLQQQAEDADAVASLAQRMLEVVSLPHELTLLSENTLPASRRAAVSSHVTLTASIGAAQLGSGGDSADSLLNNAEVALQHAKSAGRAGYSLYNAELGQAQHERNLLTQELREALAQGSLQLHYQALFDARSGKLCGYEALARWPHPRRGWVPPAEFIPLAEEAGLIAALGQWVLGQACLEAQRWPAHLTVAVNLSAAQFGIGAALVQQVEQVLTRSALAPRRLELEITESLLMQDTQDVLQTLRGLQGLGTRIAMDDFGTGFSSLSYLWRFPFNKLKIDRAFTQGLGQDAKVDTIVRSIITLAHSLGMRVNAEGVETEAQREHLCGLGCDELQGYLLARPQPAQLLDHQAHGQHTFAAIANAH